MDEGGVRVRGGEGADEEGVHGHGVGGAVANGIVRFEGEVVEGEVPFLAGGEDGDDSGERTRGVGCAGGEEGEEIGGEAGAGVVVEGEFLVQAFGGFVAAFHGEDAGAQERRLIFDSWALRSAQTVSTLRRRETSLLMKEMLPSGLILLSSSMMRLAWVSLRPTR